MKAAVRPKEIHWSTSVAQNVALVSAVITLPREPQIGAWTRHPVSVTLHFRAIGAGPRVVLIHGFGQNSLCWGPFAEHLAKHFEVILVDAPGHGESGHDDADHWEAGRLLSEVGGAATYIGYSMGGRIALHAALQSPDLVHGLVLIGAHPGIAAESDRADRRRADEARAADLDEHGLASFVDQWLANPMFAELGDHNNFRDERLANRTEGLMASILNVGTGSQEPLWDQLQRLRMPTYLIAGESDDKFVKIGLQTLDAIGPSATLSVEAGCGHAPHLEKPERVAAAIESFIVEEVLDPEPW